MLQQLANDSLSQRHREAVASWARSLGVHDEPQVRSRLVRSVNMARVALAVALALALAAPAAQARTLKVRWEQDALVAYRVWDEVGFTPIKGIQPNIFKRRTVKAGSTTYKVLWTNNTINRQSTAIALREAHRDATHVPRSYLAVYTDRPLTSAQRKRFDVMLDLGRDADVLVVNRDNPVCASGLTLAQARGIAGGTITRWSQVATLPAGQPDAIARHVRGTDRYAQPRFGVPPVPEHAVVELDGGVFAAYCDRAVAAVTSWSRVAGVHEQRLRGGDRRRRPDRRQRVHPALRPRLSDRGRAAAPPPDRSAGSRHGRRLRRLPALGDCRRPVPQGRRAADRGRRARPGRPVPQLRLHLPPRPRIPMGHGSRRALAQLDVPPRGLRHNLPLRQEVGSPAGQAAVPAAARSRGGTTRRSTTARPAGAARASSCRRSSSRTRRTRASVRTRRTSGACSAGSRSRATTTARSTLRRRRLRNPSRRPNPASDNPCDAAGRVWPGGGRCINAARRCSHRSASEARGLVPGRSSSRTRSVPSSSDGLPRHRAGRAGVGNPPACRGRACAPRDRAQRARRHGARAGQRLALRAGRRGQAASTPDAGRDVRRARGDAVDLPGGSAGAARRPGRQPRPRHARARRSRASTMATEDLVVYAHGWPPEDHHAELLPPAV